MTDEEPLVSKRIKRQFNRFNPRLTLEQYSMLQDIRSGKIPAKRGIYTKLCREWGVPQSTLSSAVTRGIKEYEISLILARQNAST
jgi:hypothetical protein